MKFNVNDYLEYMYPEDYPGDEASAPAIEYVEQEDEYDGDATGFFATSLAGHDKGMIYYVSRQEDDFVYLCDGRLKPLDRPKKKRRKHIRLIKRRVYLGTNQDIRLAIKEIKQDVKG